jgi:hypothetical protein
MQETAARDAPGMGLGQLQAIDTMDPVWDRRIMTVNVEGRIMEISLTEMDQYCDIFEEMFGELDRRESLGTVDLDGLLDEFDRAEIEHLRLCYGTVGPF